ncbi:hypothetical protein EAI_00992, partial [Harpegnathos saltator]
LSASIQETAIKILGFSVKSQNLKGTYVKVLRDAAAVITAGNSLMAKYMARDTCGENLDIIEEMKAENAELKTALSEVKKELEEVR